MQLRRPWGPRWLMLKICQFDWIRKKVWACRGQRWESRVLVFGAIVRGSLREGFRWWEQPKNNPIVLSTAVGASRHRVERYNTSELVVGVSTMVRQDAFVAFRLLACNATNRQPASDFTSRVPSCSATISSHQ